MKTPFQVVASPCIYSGLKIAIDNLRDIDRREVKAMVGHNDLIGALADSCALSDRSLIISRRLPGKPDDPLCVIGVNPSKHQALGRVWMLSTKSIESVPKVTIIKHGQYFMEGFFGLYPYLGNYIMVENKDAIRWLDKLGAKFSQETYTFNQETFKKFILSNPKFEQEDLGYYLELEL